MAFTYPGANSQFIADVCRCYMHHHYQSLIDELDSMIAKWDSDNVDEYKDIVSKGHQNHILIVKKDEAAKLLLERKQQFYKARDFEDLLAMTSRLISDAGSKASPTLWSYDIAVRIAYIIDKQKGTNLMPARFLYLYRGANDGALCVFPNNGNLPEFISTDESKVYFPNMQSVIIENLLCVCKDCLKNNKIKACIGQNNVSHCPRQTRKSQKKPNKP